VRQTLLAPLLGALLAAPAFAGGDALIVNARVAGEPEPVAILVVDGEVRRVGGPARGPIGTPRIDAAGGLVTPGRIDAWAGVDGASPLGRAVDAFDPFDGEAIREALAHGVTAVCLVPDARARALVGTAAVVKLKPDVAAVGSLVVAGDAAVCAGLGPAGASPLERVERWGELEQALAKAGRYRDAWLQYEEDLAEYVESLPAETADVDSGDRTDGGSEGEDGGDGDGGAGEGEGDGKGKGKGDGAGEGEGGEDDGPKKPERPKTDRTLALLARVLDRELPLRVRAERAEDLLNAVALQEAHGVRLVLEGATEAHLAAADLAARDVAVVLGPALRDGAPGAHPREVEPGESAEGRDLGWSERAPLRHLAANAAALERAGVAPALGTGRLARSRFAAINAGLYASAGLSRAAAEAGVTTRAAEVLGLGDRLGRLAPGYDADLVIHADAEGRRPQVVLVDGELVWEEAAR